jgi:hypothetical protein
MLAPLHRSSWRTHCARHASVWRQRLSGGSGRTGRSRTLERTYIASEAIHAGFNRPIFRTASPAVRRCTSCYNLILIFQPPAEENGFGAAEGSAIAFVARIVALPRFAGSAHEPTFRVRVCNETGSDSSLLPDFPKLNQRRCDLPPIGLSLVTQSTESNEADVARRYVRCLPDAPEQTMLRTPTPSGFEIQARSSSPDQFRCL